MTLSGYQRICVEKCLKESKNKRVIIIIVGDGPRLDCRRLDCRRLDCRRLDCRRLDCRRLDCRRLDCRRLDCRRLDCRRLDCRRHRGRVLAAVQKVFSFVGCAVIAA